MQIHSLPLSSITIPPDRQRTEIDNSYIDELSESIKIFGLINPIIVDESNTLIAGYCRIKAHEQLGRTEIYVRRWDDLSPTEKTAIEYEENARRKNLSYNDQLLAELKLYEFYQKHYGPKPSLSSHTDTARSKFRIEDMAKLLRFSYGKMSERLTLARSIRDNPELGQMKSVAQAQHEVTRRQETAVRTVLAGIKLKEHRDQQLAQGNTDTPQFETFKKDKLTLIHADSRLYIPTIPDETIGCMITDPPWNVEFDTTFGGDPDVGFKITEEVLKLVYTKLQEGSLCVMYCATRHLITGRVYNLIQSCGYAIYDSIHIWYKPHIAKSSHPYRELKFDYEPALLFSKGRGRDFNTPMYGVIADTIQTQRVHPAQKSPVVLSQLIANFTTELDIVLDPFMGSGQTLLGCKLVDRHGIGIESVKETYDTAVVQIDK